MAKDSADHRSSSQPSRTPSDTNPSSQNSSNQPSPAGSGGDEAHFVDLLVSYDESLARGVPAQQPPTADDVSGVLQQELEDATECLQWLEQLWPRNERPASAWAAVRSDDSASMAADVSDHQSHQLGRFQIRQELGRGGGGIVYLAYDPQLMRQVALKVPHPEFIFAADLCQRFLQEARCAAQLDHPHIVPVYEIGEVGPMWYIATAYCPGPTLATWLDTRSPPVAARTAVRLIEQLTRAVEYAHHCNILHRDLKPSNVLLERQRKCHSSLDDDDDLAHFVPKLTDFGLALPLHTGLSITRTGAILGTPAYMAPEQAEGRTQDVSAATDVYALGVILYELLTGRVPFHHDSDIVTLRQIVFDEPPAPRRLCPGIPRDLESICLRCLEKHPRDRYASVTELADDFRRFSSSRPTVARPAGIGKRILKCSRRQPAATAFSIALLLGLILTLAIFSYYRHNLVEATQVASTARRSALRLQRESRLHQSKLQRHAYVDSIKNAFQAWSNARIESALSYLDDCLPGPGENDERGFEWYYIGQLCNGFGRKMNGHQGEVIRATSFSPDGQQIVTGGDDGFIHVWQPIERKLLRKFRADAGVVRDVAYSPDGQWIASVGEDGTLKLWESDQCTLRRVITPDTDELWCLAFSPDSHQIAVGGDGGDITVWNLTEDKPCLKIAVDGVDVNSLDFSMQGKLLAACGDGSAKIWELSQPETPIQIIRLPKEVFYAKFSPDGSELVTTGDLVNVWRVADGTKRLYLPGHDNFIRTAAFSADGKLLATGGNDQVIRIWDLANGSTLHRYHAHTRPILDMAFAPQSNLLVSADKGGTIRTWDADTPPYAMQLTLNPPDTNRRFAFSPTNRTIAVATVAPTNITTWEVSPNGQLALQKQRLANPAAEENRLLNLSYFDAGKFLLACTSDHWSIFDHNLNLIDTIVPDVESGVSEITYSRDGQRLAVMNTETGRVGLLDMEGREIGSVDGQGTVALSSDGTLLATESTTTAFAIEVVGIRTGELRSTLRGHTGHTSSIAFSNDDRILASGSGDGAVRLWNLERGEAMTVLRGHAGGMHVAFSPDGNTLVSAGSDGTIRFWDVITGRSLMVLPVSKSGFHSLKVFRDGQLLAVNAEATAMLYAPR